MLAYINGVDCISAQLENNTLVPLEKGQVCVTAHEPLYTEFIPSGKIRRMDKLSKMGLYSSKVCMKDAGVEEVDGIVVGVGQTFSDNPAVILEKLIDNDEGLINPGMFMNSLLSSASGQIALELKCYGYNNTLTQRGFSFESALLDGIMQMEIGECENILVGGLDVVTDTYLELAHEYGYVNSSGFDSGAYFSNEDNERTVGEGSGFFMLSSHPNQQSYAALKGLKCLYLPEPGRQLTDKLAAFLQENHIVNTNIDLVLSGKGFDHLFEEPYLKTEENLFRGVPHLYFKRYCGEYPTATTFGLWMGAQILKNQALPENDPVNATVKGNIETILLINSFAGNYFTFLLLQKP
ncbi:MAG: hypothetical protein KDC85_10335 [Saprospiraceae bacterium]|nr:hypothetical protein [Saprospiraceae bacterium]MCB9325742.1 hypothetical protein [Lewinellaceae bacterium]